nr:multidrug effflux MFS transporter [Microbacterium aquimaris]
MIDPGSARRVGPGLLTFLAAISVLGPLSMSILLAGLPQMADTLATTEGGTQASLSACVVGLAVGQLFAGPLSDTVGRRLPLVAGLGVWTLATFACAVAPNIETMIAFRAVQGLTGGIGMALGRAVIRDLTEGEELIRQYARLGAASGVAPILSPLLGSLVMLFAPWQGVFVFLGAIGVALTAYAAFGYRESLPESRRRTPRPRELVADYRDMLRDPRFVWPCLVVAFSYAAMFSYVLSSSFIYSSAYGLTGILFSILFGINGAGFAIASNMGGRLALRFGVRRVVLSAFPVAAAACAMMAVLWWAGVREWPALAACLFVMVAALGVTMPLGVAWAMRSQPDRAGAASGVLGVTQFAIGGIVGPLVSIVNAPGPLGLALVAASSIAVASVSALGMARRH